MSDYWIKMRGSLINSPKLIRVARELQSNKRFRQWLAENADWQLSDAGLRTMAMGLLCLTWSAAREHGTFTGNDLVLHGLTLDDVDSMSGAPGVGLAMESVFWAIESTQPVSVTLPNFKEWNIPRTPAERMRDSRRRRESGEDESCCAPLRSRNNGATKHALETETETELKKSTTSTKKAAGVVDDVDGEELQEAIEQEALDREQVKGAYRRILGVVPIHPNEELRTKQATHDFAIRVACLVAGQAIPLACLDDVIETMKSKNRKVGDPVRQPKKYFHKALRSNCDKHQPPIPLDDLMLRVVPSTVAAGPPGGVPPQPDEPDPERREAKRGRYLKHQLEQQFGSRLDDLNAPGVIALAKATLGDDGIALYGRELSKRPITSYVLRELLLGQLAKTEEKKP